MNKALCAFALCCWLLVFVLLMSVRAPLHSTVKTDLEALNNNVVAARDTLKSGGGTIQAAATSIKTLLGTPTHNPNSTTVHGLVTDLKDDIDPDVTKVDVVAALASVGGVLNTDPTTTTPTTDLKKQADDIKSAVGIPASNPSGNTIDGCVTDLKDDIDPAVGAASIRAAVSNVGAKLKEDPTASAGADDLYTQSNDLLARLNALLTTTTSITFPGTAGHATLDAAMTALEAL